MSAGVRNITVSFNGNASGLQHAAEQGAAATSKFQQRAQKAAKIGLAATAAFGGALVASLKSGVEGLNEGAEAEAKLAQSLKRVPKTVKISSDALKAHAEEIQRNTKFTYEDALATDTFLAAQDGIQKAVSKGVSSVQHLTSVSLNLATVQGKDGPTAAKQLAKWLAAPAKATGALLKAGIALTASEQAKIKAWTKSGEVGKAQALILEKVEAKTNGAAAAAGETMSGKIERAKNAFGEMQESLAAGLIPVLTTLTDKGLVISNWLQDNPEKVKLLVIVFGSLAAVIGTVSLAVKVWSAITKTFTAIQAAFNAVLALNPVVLLTIALVAVGVALVIAYRKSDRFRAIVQGLGETVKHAASVAIDWFGRMKDKLIAVVQTVAPILGNIAKIVTTPWRLAISGIASIWNNTIGKLSFSIPDWVPGIGGKGFDVPDIPMLAKGGVVRRATLAMIGEAGPEAVVPLDGQHSVGGPEILELHVDLGEGIREVVRVNLRKQGRGQKLAASAGARRAAAAW